MKAHSRVIHLRRVHVTFDANLFDKHTFEILIVRPYYLRGWISNSKMLCVTKYSALSFQFSTSVPKN